MPMFNDLSLSLLCEELFFPLLLQKDISFRQVDGMPFFTLKCDIMDLKILHHAGK